MGEYNGSSRLIGPIQAGMARSRSREHAEEVMKLTRFWRWGGVAFVLCTLAGESLAETIVVTPNYPNGWRVVAANGAKSRLTGSPPFGPYPVGAFYAQTGQQGSGGNTAPPPGQVWIGTDRFSGTRIADISRLTYSTYTFQQGIDPEHFVRQPFQLQLVIYHTPESQSFVTLMHRPWGLLGVASGNPYLTWETHDAMAEGSIWFDVMSQSSGNWAWVVSQHPEGVLAAPPAGTGWDNKTQPPGQPHYTGTGASLNFEVGARKSISNVFGQNSYAWWRESYGFAGYVDGLTVGVNGAETTFDFEASPPLLIRNSAVAEPLIKAASNVWDQFVVWGKVLEQDYVVSESFLVDEGAGSPVKVLANGYYVEPGQFVKVTGSLSPNTTPPTISALFIE